MQSLPVFWIQDTRHMPFHLTPHCQMQKRWLKEETESLQQDTQCEETQSDDSSTLSKRPRTEENQKKLIDEMYDTMLGATSEVAVSSLEGELQQYLLEPVVDRRMGKPLEWWKKNEKRLPILAPLSRKFLCPHLLLCPVRESSVKSEPFMKRNEAGLQGRMLKNSVFYTTT